MLKQGRTLFRGIRTAIVLVGCLAGSCFLAAPAGALSPPPVDRAEIVFSNGGRIVSMQADGSGRTVLTHPDLGDGEYDDGDASPEISPDGSRMLFIRTNEDRDDVYKYELMVASRQGANPLPILKGASSNDSKNSRILYSATWSADGQSIFYVEINYRRTTLNSRIVRVKADGTGRKVLATERVDYRKLESSNFRPRDFMFYSGVDASPDGRKLLVGRSGMFFKPGLISELRVMNLATGKMRILEKVAEAGTWSPDGSKIAFTSQRQRRDEQCYESSCDYQSKIFVMKADGSGARPLIRDSRSGDEYSPKWSSDSSRIAFSSNRNSPESDSFGMEIYSVGVDGSCLTWLTNGSPPSGTPNWAPGGLDANPGSCGSAGRKPFVESALFATPPGSEMTTYWLGPVFRGMAPLYFTYGDMTDSGFNQYGDCVSWDPEVCHRRPEVTVITKPVCRSQISNRLEMGTLAGVKEKKGALLFGSTGSGWKNPLIATGRSVVSLGAYGPNGGLSIDRVARIAGDAFDALRPAGTDQPVDRLPEAILNRNDIRKASRVAAQVARAGSVRKLDESSRRLNFRQIRSYLQFDRSIRSLGGVRTVACASRQRRAGNYEIPTETPLPLFSSTR